MFWLDVSPARSRAPGFVEEKDRWVFTADAPGVRKSDVSITVEAGALTVTATRDTAAPGRLLHGERRDFAFRRTWSLPDGVDVDGISAALEDGVLTLSVPKPPAARPRRVDVQVH
jgi:HSP20 family protein